MQRCPSLKAGNNAEITVGLQKTDFQDIRSPSELVSDKMILSVTLKLSKYPFNEAASSIT